MRLTTRRRLLRATAYAAVLGALALVASQLTLRYDWHWGLFFERWARLLRDGIGLTLGVAFASMLLALPLGVAFGLCRTARDPVARLLGAAYVEVVRGTPLLVQVMLWYHVLLVPLNRALAQAAAAVGLPEPSLGSFGAAVCALSCFAGSYIAEIVRAGVQSIDKGQVEAARSLGLTHVQALRHVVLPQALRRTLPPLASEFIALVKDSSLASVIGLSELTMRTRDVQAASYLTFEVWLTTAALYFVICAALSFAVRRLERRLGVGHQEGEGIR